ncbi:hypothetical protein Tco_0517291 [Tanacetum coccineum]
MLHPHADSDVFQRYTQFCARNVRLRFSADFAEAMLTALEPRKSAQMIDKLNLRSHSSVIGVTMDGHDPLNPQAILTSFEYFGIGGGGIESSSRKRKWKRWMDRLKIEGSDEGEGSFAGKSHTSACGRVVKQTSHISMQVVSILARKRQCECASTDEVYLDLTDAAKRMLKEMPLENLESLDKNVLKSLG